MPNYTIDDYKNAIKKKYEVEKRGEYSNHFNPPSNINLKNLCIKRYNSNSNNNEEDLEIFFSFFGFAFDPTRRNLFNDYLNRFKNVRSFLTGKTISPKDETIHFSAVIVDFHPRPLHKFLLEWKGDGYNSPNDSDPINVNEEQIVENPVSTVMEGGVEVELLNTRVNLFLKIKEKILNRFKRRIKITAMIVAIIFGLVSAVIYFAFFKNHCMQWSDNHYEVVDCSSKNTKNTNDIIPLDKDLLDFRKLKACDTTTCFKKNGEAFVWYAKTHNGIDFFNDNGNGRHPECKNSLRPVTYYIFNKYLKDKPCK